jgi:hypothetical protein
LPFACGSRGYGWLEHDKQTLLHKEGAFLERHFYKKYKNDVDFVINGWYIKKAAVKRAKK